MVAPAPKHLVMSMRGPLGDPAQAPEEWQINVRMTLPLTIAEAGDIDGDWLQDYTEDARDWIRSSGMRFTTDVHLTECRFAVMSDAGPQNGETVIKTPAEVNSSQGQINPYVPWQNSVVVTLLADGRGRGHRGRWFLPPQQLTIENGLGTMTAAHQNGIADATKTFIEALNNHPGLDTQGTSGNVCIIGRTPPEGTRELVDKIRVGRVVDTMRSRRKSLDESYVERTL